MSFLFGGGQSADPGPDPAVVAETQKQERVKKQSLERRQRSLEYGDLSQRLAKDNQSMNIPKELNNTLSGASLLDAKLLSGNTLG